jgi:sialate O-acetylesterase
MVKLDPLAAGGPHELVVVGANTIAVQDILVGGVWLRSGQSNMERQLGPRGGQGLNVNWEQEAAAANFPQIRHFGVAQKLDKRPVPDVTDTWVVCSPETVKEITAVGYFFARDLARNLKVPIGLLHSSLGGTKVVQWTSQEALLETDDWPIPKGKHEE